MEQNTLAWHETLELHELTAFKSIGLMKTKMGLNQIHDHHLKNIYQQTIQELEADLGELAKFYPYTPKPGNSNEYRIDNGFYAGDLLAFSKTAVRNYAIAITETASDVLREVLRNQLDTAITCHERIYNYMYRNEMYPSYNLNQLLQSDINMVKKALSM
ncbi:spore coat protein F [Lentibacillus halodurans]|uniref:Spore coat protein F n=1 Tax=Lentibacillus halodurans TaxID=237679 RepID=A0A1I0W9Y5_9BACI|nr:spore coat protein [Lentibacillus halodurans]SFA85575.1 spore coat protein F [Lentibacillus halodurans]